MSLFTSTQILPDRFEVKSNRVVLLCMCVFICHKYLKKYCDNACLTIAVILYAIKPEVYVCYKT